MSTHSRTEERICNAIDAAAFDVCADPSPADLTAITNALNACGITATEQDVTDASSGDVAAACLEEQVASGATDADATEVLRIVNAATTCSGLATALTQLCSEV